MDESALTWAMNNPYCIALLGIVIIVGCVAVAIDCWKKWH